MKQLRLNLYTVNLKYIRNLAHVDDNVFSVSPQIGKSERPFLGVVVICGTKQYCVPFSSPKNKHLKMKNDVDFSKIYDEDGKLLGVLNFNNMIPVRADIITKIDLKVYPHDDPQTKRYKVLAAKQINFCRKNQDCIVRKANKLYKLITEGRANSYLTKRCCKFTELEKILDRF